MAQGRRDTKSHSDQMVDGILSLIRQLIPSVTIHCETVASVNAPKKQGFSKKGISGNAGLHYGKNEINIWFDLSNAATCLLRVSREHIPLTKGESEILGRLPDALSGVLVSAAPRSLELAQRIAARLSVATILVSRYLRGGRATTYWTPALILGELQQLTFRRYEGHSCTTGFVYTSKPKLYFARLPIEEYDFIHFIKPVTLKANQLDTPASFRYVDGRNSFYLIDNWQKLHGIFASSDPKLFGMVDRCSLMHILPLVKTMPGRVWAAFVGQNNDVNVVASGGVHLRWDGNCWHMRDISILTSILETQGCSQDLSNAIAMVCHALSDLRSGTVILIPDDVENLPNSVGSIDSSDLGKALRSAFLNQSFVDLKASNSILGILTSDGLTTISKEGNILSCGDIIDISDATHMTPTGGGRTQAAVAASTYGVALKVSEDGPITMFKHKKQLIRM